MKKFCTFVSVVFMFFGFVLSAFAIEAPSNLNVVSSTGSTVNLSWDKLDKASLYIVYYGTKPGLETSFEKQTDYIETNSVEIKDLVAGTYYFSVVALDELADEGTFSKEISLNVGGTSDGIFVLKTIDVVSLNGIELTFSEPLENIEDSVREFKIVNKNDPLDTFEVIKTEVNLDDNTKVLLTLDKDTQEGGEYEVTVTAIKSLDGKTIESGIDSTEVFIAKVIDNSNAEVDSGVVLNAAQTAELTTNTGTGVELLAAAESTEKLPNTGTEHVLLLLISLILGFGFFIFKIKKA